MAETRDKPIDKAIRVIFWPPVFWFLVLVGASLYMMFQPLILSPAEDLCLAKSVASMPTSLEVTEAKSKGPTRRVVPAYDTTNTSRVGMDDRMDGDTVAYTGIEAYLSASPDASAPGRHKLELRLGFGYFPGTSKIEIKSDQTTQLSLEVTFTEPQKNTNVFSSVFLFSARLAQQVGKGPLIGWSFRIC